jgi:hypothetical protein
LLYRALAAPQPGFTSQIHLLQHCQHNDKY